MVETRFTDREHGGYFTTGDGHEGLIARTKTVHDGALPAGTGRAGAQPASARRAHRRRRARAPAHAAIAAQAALVNRHPRLFAHLLMAVDFRAQAPREIVISGERGEPGPRRCCAPCAAVPAAARGGAGASAHADVALLPLLADRAPDRRQRKAYVCRHHTCAAPVDDADALARALCDARNFVAYARMKACFGLA